MGQPHGGGSSSDKYKRVMLGGTSYQLPKVNATGFVNSIIQALDKTNHPVTVTGDPTIETDPQGFFDRNVAGILRTYWDELPAETRTFIEDTMKGHGGFVVSRSNPNTSQKPSDGNVR